MSKFSNVEAITLELKFVDPDRRVGPSERKLDYPPTDILDLSPDCPYRSCVDGGFNVTGDITAAIARNEVSVSGERICQGWQDPRRRGSNHCLCEMTYKATIEYKNT